MTRMKRRTGTLAALLLSLGMATGTAVGDELLQIPQGWNDEIRDKFWFTSQGSGILPYDWFLHLEEAAGTERFARSEHMNELRYVTLSESRNPVSLNPDGLPIGFVKDKEKNSWLGLTCAACHTNQIDVGPNHYIIEGAPTLANFPRFFGELIAALETTDEDEANGECLLGEEIYHAWPPLICWGSSR